MKILIIENETYLAQSIALKLNNLNYDCTILPAPDPKNAQNFDVILLSNNAFDANGHNTMLDFITKNKRKIIIILTSFMNDATVTKPIKAGACDYILKPFMIDDLVRKLEHYIFHRRLLKKMNFFDRFFATLSRNFESIAVPLRDFSGSGQTFPFVIQSRAQVMADIFAMRFARENDFDLQIFHINSDNFSNFYTIFSRQIKDDDRGFYYISGLEYIDRHEISDFFAQFLQKNVIFSFIGEDFLGHDALDPKNVIKLDDVNDFISDVLSLKDYEKAVIVRFNEHYTNIDLAKKLGISRKSLWEKKKRYVGE